MASYRRIKYPSGRITPAVLGINVIDSPPNTINMVGILSDVFAADKETTGGYYEDKYNNIDINNNSLVISPYDILEKDPETAEHKHADKRQTTES